MKGKTCCVTGHRDLPQNEINKIKAALEHEIDAAVTDGFTCFMSGFADGVDQYFAELVLERKQTNRSAAQKNPVNKICLLLVFSVPTERAAIATGNDLRGLGICHQQALAGIPETGFLLNTQSYVRLHCLPVVLRVFGRGSVYSCRIDKPLITAYNRVVILNCYNREMQKNKIFCPL